VQVAGALDLVATNNCNIPPIPGRYLIVLVLVGCKRVGGISPASLLHYFVYKTRSFSLEIKSKTNMEL
jgi:hypothetical protein